MKLRIKPGNKFRESPPLAALLALSNICNFDLIGSGLNLPMANRPGQQCQFMVGWRDDFKNIQSDHT